MKYTTKHNREEDCHTWTCAQMQMFELHRKIERSPVPLFLKPLVTPKPQNLVRWWTLLLWTTATASKLYLYKGAQRAGWGIAKCSLCFSMYSLHVTHSLEQTHVWTNVNRDRIQHHTGSGYRATAFLDSTGGKQSNQARISQPLF